MSSPSQPTVSASPSAWAMLLAFTAAFALSQAFRTVAAIIAPPLSQQFGLTPRQLGLFAGSFHFAFGGLQLFMGIGMDVYGPKRTVLWVFPLAIGGALLAVVAQDFVHLLIAQVLIGIGCAPAFVACTLFIAKRFPAERFAALSGAILGLGSVGMLVTGTPLALLVEATSWRGGFAALAVLAGLAWIGVAIVVREPAVTGARRLSVWSALRGYGELFRLPHTWGIVALGLVSYASFMALRGLWLGPLLVDRHGFGLVASGHVALAVSVVSMLGPPVYGRLDPGDARRRRWLFNFTWVVAAMYVVMAFNRNAVVDVTMSIVLSLVSGYMVLQYADVKSAYPAHMTGRAMAIFTMAMFMGVAIVQWLTGVVAGLAGAAGQEPYAWVLGTIAMLLMLGMGLFRWVPGPERR